MVICITLLPRWILHMQPLLLENAVGSPRLESIAIAELEDICIQAPSVK